MISKILTNPSPSSSSSSHQTVQSNQPWNYHHHHLDMFVPVDNLCHSTSKQRTLYGVNLYTSPVSTQNQNEETNKCDLSSKVKSYLRWCYLMLGWQKVSAGQLEVYLNSLPETQDQIEEIRIQGNLLKFTKNDMALSINLNKISDKTYDSIQVCPNYYHLNCSDKTGKNELLEYERSLTKITVEKVDYRFNGLVNIVEGTEGFVGVATVKSVYIINLRTSSIVTSFPIQDCIDLKWGSRGLYYLTKSGSVGLLQKQTTYIPLSNSFLSTLTYQVPMSSKQLSPQRILLTPQPSSSLLLLSCQPSNPKKLHIHTVDTGNNIKTHRESVSFEVKDTYGQVLYKNMVMVGRQIGVVVVSGKQGKVQTLNVYRFSAV